MRRPLAIAGFSLLIANLLCLIFGTTVAAVISGLSLIGLFLLLLFRNNSHLQQALGGCCFFLLLGALSFLLVFHINIQPLASLHNTTQYTEFTVLQQTGSYHTTNYIVASVKGLYPNPKKECKIRIAMEDAYSVSPGNVAGGMLTFSAKPTYNLMGDGIYLTATLSQEITPVVLGQETSLSYYAYTARQTISSHFQKQGNQNTYALVKGICLGEANELSLSLQTDFYSCGLGHLVAVSGLHTGEIAGLFIGLFILLTKQKRWVKLFSLSFVWAFVFLTGASFSSLRSAVMFSFLAIGSCFLRKPDSLNTLGGAVTAILLCNPLAAGNVGFLASVSACVGLILLATPLQEQMHRRIPAMLRNTKSCKAFTGGLSATLSATVATIPCNLLSFRSLSLIAPIANLICVPIATGILIFGLLGAVFSMLPPFSIVGSLCLWLAHGTASFIMETATLLATVPYHSVAQGTPTALVGFLVFGGGTLWMILGKRPSSKRVKTLVILLLCLGMVFSCLLPAFPQNTTEFCFLANSYDGGMLAVHGKTAVYIGVSMTYELDQLLSSRGITQIDLWVVPQREHYSTSLTTIAKQFAVNQIMTYEAAQSMGLFSPWEAVPPITNQSTKTVGNITVTTRDCFQSFTVTVGNTTLYYGDSREEKSHNVPLAFVTRTANDTCHTVTCNGTTKNIDTTTVIRVRNNKTKVYQPKFLF